MFGLRSAQGRAILAGMVLVLLLVAVGAVAVWRASQDEQSLATLDRMSSAATALARAEAGFWQAQGALSALVMSGDPALADDYDSAFAAAEQNLAEARAQFTAVGEADKVSALDGLTNRIGQFNQEVKPFFPVIIEGDRQLVLELANSSMSEMTTTSTAIIADLQGMVQEAQQDASAERAAAGRAADVTLWLLLGLSGVALATGVGTVVMLVGSVVGPLIALRASARAITSGRPQARAKVSGPEEVASLARDFNEMTDALAAKTEAVRESERRYRLLADNASDIIWTSDLNLRFTYQSPAVTRIRGYSPEEAMAQTPDQVMTPASLEVARKVLAEELAIENMEQKDLSRSRTLEVEQYCKDGSTIWTEVNMAFLRDEDGRAVGLLGASRQITERKLAEEALQESEIRYRLLAENASDHVWTMDLGLRYTYVSPSVTRMRGYTVEEVVRGGVAQTLTPASLEIAKKILAEELAEERTGPKDPFRSRSLEVEMSCKDGSTIWTEVSVTFLRDPDGRPVGILGVTRDISKRRRAEEALRESEARYKALFAGAPEGMLVADLQTKQFRYANPAMCRMFGYTEEEFLRIGVVDIHPKLSLDHVLAEFEAQARGEKLLSPGLPCLRKDGTLFYANISAITTVLDGRECNVGIFSDVTEHKRAEEELRETRDYLEKLIDHANAPIIVWDPSFTITRFNNAFERLTGRPASDVLGQRLEVLFPEPERAASMEKIARTLRGEFWELIEIPVLHQSGEVRQVLWNSANITGADGRTVVATIAQGTDITERKRAEEERERLHAELEVRAITDGLTGLYNHAQFFQRLSEETERSGRYNHGFAVAMMDVDNFKKFNDSRGHQQGDKILRLVADSIRSGLRRSDLAFRYGGDEFAAIMLHADAARARTVIDRINRHLARNLKQMNDEAASRVSLSAGVACFGHDGRTADELALVADTNLYSAKWAARARSAAGEEYAIQSLAAPPGTSEMGLPSNTVGSLATVLRELGVPDALAELNLRTIAALGTLAEVRDPYIRGHQERTSEVAVSVAEEMGLSSDRVRGIRLAGLLHDLGKAGISKRILNKPGKLTEEEFAEIKEHPPLGSMMIISEIQALQQVVPIVRHHHEHFDGKGYPDGLAGQDIPLEARILGVVDAFDAMTHERAYRKAMSKEEALAELERGAGTQFDPAVVEAFLALAPTEGDGLPARRQPAKEDKEPAALPTA